MTSDELQARAIQRAKDLNTHIMRLRGRPGVYTCTSSENKRKHYVLIARDGMEVCSCEGFAYRQNCRHVEALRNRLAREAPLRRRNAAPLPASSSFSVTWSLPAAA